MNIVYLILADYKLYLLQNMVAKIPDYNQTEWITCNYKYYQLN